MCYTIICTQESTSTNFPLFPTHNHKHVVHVHNNICTKTKQKSSLFVLWFSRISNGTVSSIFFFFFYHKSLSRKLLVKMCFPKWNWDFQAILSIFQTFWFILVLLYLLHVYVYFCCVLNMETFFFVNNFLKLS